MKPAPTLGLACFLAAGLPLLPAGLARAAPVPAASTRGVEAPANDEAQRFGAWLEQMWEENLALNPVQATAIGDERYNDRLPDFTSEAFRAQQKALAERQAKELERFDRKKLSGQALLSYDILRGDLKEQLESFRYPFWMLPLNQFGSAPSFFAQMGAGKSIQPFRHTQDYERWLARMKLAVPVLDGMVRNMREGMAKGVVQPRALMEKTVPQLAALAVEAPEKSLFWGPLESFPEAVSKEDRTRLTAAYRKVLKEELLPAYQRLLVFVRDEYLPKCRDTVAWTAHPDGKAWYAYLVKSSTTTELTPEAIHQLGLSEVARIRGEMEKVKREVGFGGDLHAFFEHLKTDPRFYYQKPDELLAGFRELQTRINALLPAAFDVKPKADYEVRAIEAFRAESAAGAQYQPGTPDGKRPGIFYVNTFNLKAQPKFEMETLSLHEASPGHHFQISIAQEVESLPKFRRFNGYVAYSEGWALYAESLGPELGLFKDPYQRYGYLNAEQLRAMRLVVDTGLHAKGWSREKAIRYMLDNSSMAESDAVAEVERYIAVPGQALGYKIGQLELKKLRAEAEKALGKRFDLKAFHREVLVDGALPLKVLGTKLRAWQRQRGS